MVQQRKHYSPTFKAQVVQEVLAGEKSLRQIAAQYGIQPNMIGKWKRAALEAMPSTFDEESQLQTQAQMAALKAHHEKEKEELHAEIGRLTMQVNWLQKKLQQELPRTSRLALVERDEPELPLSLQAKLLGVSRSSLYYQPMPPSAEEIVLKHRIDAIYTAYPFYGSRRITEQLRREEWQINRKAVQRHMREMGLEAIYPGPISQRGGSRIRSILTSCTSFRLLAPIRSGVLISRMCAYSRDGCTWWQFWTGTPAMSSVGNWIKAWKWPLTSKRLSEPWLGLYPRLSIAIKAVISPVLATRNCSKSMLSRSVWMAKGARWILSLPRDCGEPSSMRICTCRTIALHGKLVRASLNT